VIRAGLVAAALVVAAAAPVAAGDETPAAGGNKPPAAAGKKTPAAAGNKKIGLDRIDAMWEAREVLRRREVAGFAHADRVARERAARARLNVRLLGLVIERRAELARTIDALVTADRLDRRAAPVALQLLGEIYIDQYDTIDRLGMTADDLAERDRKLVPDVSQVPRGNDAAIPVWQQLVDRYPRHPASADVLDPLAEAYIDAGRYDEAKLALQRLLCGNRASEIAAADQAVQKAGDDLAARVYAQQVRIADYQACVPRVRDRELVDDAWLRLAWLHRSASGELDQAISAYERVAGDPSSPSYVGALQEEAAAFYEGDREIDAIPVLDALAEYLDRKLVEEKVDEPTWPEVRHQTIERLGRIIAELWRASAVPDPNAARDLALIYFRGRSHQRHVRDVFIAAGAALRSFGAFEQALPMWGEVLATWPEHPGAPAVHARMIDLLVEKGDPVAADAERRRFLDAFAPDSRWRRANARNRSALAAADRTGEEVLFTLAGNRYRQMSLAGDGGDAATLAADAADLELRFVRDYPRSKRAYEAGFRLAHALAVAGRRDQAIERLRWVRDQDPHGAHFGEATRLIVEALEQARAQALADGSLVEPPLPDKKALETATAQPLPPLIGDLQRAYDDLAAALGGAPAAARPRLEAAMIDLRWGRIEPAEDRLERLVRDHCATPVAREASEQLARIGEAHQRGGALAAAAQTLFQRACGDSRAIQAMRDARITGTMKEADDLAGAGRWEDAGRAYWTAFRESSVDHPAHDDALYRAADAMLRAGHLDAARALAEQFVGTAELHGSEYYAEALQLAASLAARAFDHDGAVDALLELVDLAGQKGYHARAGFDLGAAATAALAVAAELRALDRIYYDRGAADPGAVTLYVRYAARPGLDADKISRAYLHASEILERARDAAALAKLVDDWEARLGKQPAAAPYRVALQHHLARAYEAAGDLRGASRAYVRVIEAFDASGKKPGSQEAALAAEAQFWTAQDAFTRLLEPHVFRWPEDMSEKEIGARVEALAKAGDRVEKEYQAVLRFDTSWTVAAKARIGDVYLRVADKLLEAPPPRKLGDLASQLGTDALDAFVDKLRGAIQPIYDGAAESWKQALADAQQRDDHGPWVRHAREQLNRFDPAGYPVLREEIIPRQEEP